MGDGVLWQCASCGATNRVPVDKARLRARCGRCRTPLDPPGGKPLAVTDVTFRHDVLEAPVPVLVDCWAPWCGPCRALGPVIDAVAVAYAGRVRVAKLNVDDSPVAAAQYGIQGIPTLLFIKQGQLVGRLVGVQPRAAIEARLDAMLQEPVAG